MTQDEDEAELAALATELADALRSVADLTELVDDVADSGRTAFTLHDVDALDGQLADVAFDSRLEPAAALRDGGANSPTGRRVLVFHAAGLSVELEIDAEQILGQLVPAGPAVVTFDAPSGPVVRAVVDEFGFFAVPSPPPQPLRMRCAGPSGVLRTNWFLA